VKKSTGKWVETIEDEKRGKWDKTIENEKRGKWVETISEEKGRGAENIWIHLLKQ
jgi:hypothetical protein